MNKLRTLLLLTCLAVLGTALANPVNENEAANIASRFFAHKSFQASNLKRAHKALMPSATMGAEKTAYYVFNADRSQGGYVIVAGDDRAPAVLGYSDNGKFDINDVPEAMQELLDSYAEQIEALDQGEQVDRLVSPGPAIAPLLTSTWSQKSPYNHLLPLVNGSRAVVGCAATAMAQVMYYWKWPARPTTTIPAYTTESYSIYMPALPPVDFNWEAMQDCYLTSDTLSEAGLAAATLSLYCAQALEMNFQDGTSGATTSRTPLWLSTYFGYKASAHSLWRFNYTTDEWAGLIYQELAANRPVIFSGSKKTGGHAFICDGFDGEGMFHINWGWNGQSNGFFLLNVLNPDLQGTGSASGVYGYIYNQAAIVGIEPGEGENEFALTSTNVVLNDVSTTRSGSNYDFRINVSGYFRNLTSQILAVSYGWGFYQGETLKSVLYKANGTSLKPGSYYNAKEKILSFGSDLTSGTYYIVPIYSEYSANNWRPCIGAERNSFEIVINGNSCTITSHGNISEPNYTVNEITMEGTMENGRPVDINVNLTNNGELSSRLLYMFADGTFKAAGMVDLGNGETDDIAFRLMPADAGTYTLTWSWNDDGSDPIATRTITINQMPEASLSGTLAVLNVTDETNKIVTSDKFSVLLTVTNNGTQTYDEELSFKLYKNTYGNTGTSVQGLNTPIVLEPGETKTVQVDFDNVVNGWRYFVNAYYYSAGEQIKIKGTSFHTIVFPEEPEFQLGDVNDDHSVDIDDVTLLIAHILNNEAINELAADMNDDQIIDIDDVTRLIQMILGN